MIAIAPEKRISGQEIADFVPAIVEDQRAPVLMRAFTRIFMLVEGGAVESGQRPVVAGKVGGHPINEHANAGFMERVEQKLKIFRRAVAACWRVEAGDLITP